MERDWQAEINRIMESAPDWPWAFVEAGKEVTGAMLSGLNPSPEVNKRLVTSTGHVIFNIFQRPDETLSQPSVRQTKPKTVDWPPTLETGFANTSFENFGSIYSAQARNILELDQWVTPHRGFTVEVGVTSYVLDPMRQAFLELVFNSKTNPVTEENMPKSVARIRTHSVGIRLRALAVPSYQEHIQESGIRLSEPVTTSGGVCFEGLFGKSFPSCSISLGGDHFSFPVQKGELASPNGISLLRKTAFEIAGPIVGELSGKLADAKRALIRSWR